MEKIGDYAIQIKTMLSFERAIEAAKEHLKEEGFGVLMEIDAMSTFKEKLDVDWQPYHILGACNPPFALKALQADKSVGVLLPCNVVVWDEGEYRVIAAMNPQLIGEITNNPIVRSVAYEAKTRLERVLEKLEKQQN